MDHHRLVQGVTHGNTVGDFVILLRSGQDKARAVYSYSEVSNSGWTVHYKWQPV